MLAHTWDRAGLKTRASQLGIIIGIFTHIPSTHPRFRHVLYAITWVKSDAPPCV